MRLGFLFGSGVSLACGAPSTKALTDSVLRGHNVHRHTNGTYIHSTDDHPGLRDREGLERIKGLLAFLYSHANCFFEREKNGNRTPNYEDLYYLVTQLADAADEYENPAISDFLESVKTQFVVPALPQGSGFPSMDLFHETRRYIRGIVSDLLSILQPAQEHIRPLVEAALDPSVSGLEIFTLNHDLLIERTFDSAGVRFSSGFAPVSKDLQCWNCKGFAADTEKVRLSKLHGSVDWYPMRFSDGGPSRVCIAMNGDVEHALDPKGRVSKLLDDRPAVLIGTFNKMLEYSMGIYADLFCAFRTALSKLDRLVISGYSFGDKGINASLTEWTRWNSHRRMLVISPDASKYRETARGAIRRLFNNCEAQITTRDAKFEIVTWLEIARWSGIVG